ncbi:hypothetical protein D5S17_20660 [Pseudonocardiaceae bacterium YIM PH 21723]|nr:hypothetical protein D5S17_20660 [Pseudonocardiaceae bacterium YIM PH 21723]
MTDEEILAGFRRVAAHIGDPADVLRMVLEGLESKLGVISLRDASLTAAGPDGVRVLELDVRFGDKPARFSYRLSLEPELLAGLSAGDVWSDIPVLLVEQLVAFTPRLYREYSAGATDILISDRRYLPLTR